MPPLPAPSVPAESIIKHGLNQALTSAADYARSQSADATRRAYESDFRDFAKWCEAQAVPCLPAAPETCAAYLAALADRGLKASTITRRAAAIGYVHRTAAGSSPVASELVKAVLKGIRRRIGVAVERKSPATARAIVKLLAKLPDTLAGKRDRALLLLGFAAALRRSELVTLQVSDLERTPEGVIVHIRRSKTDQLGAGHQVAVPRGTRLRPVEAVDAWLAAANLTEGPIFRAVAKGDRVQANALTSNHVALIIKKYARAARFDASAFSGHSLRAGFVTSALEAGADLLKVMDVTRHREVKTLKAYDRRAQSFRNHAGKGFL